MSVIFALHLEKRLTVAANGAFFGRRLAVMLVSALKANPQNGMLFIEYGSVLHVFYKLTVALLVLFFNLAHFAEKTRDFRKTFRLCLFGRNARTYPSIRTFLRLPRPRGYQECRATRRRKEF